MLALMLFSLAATAVLLLGATLLDRAVRMRGLPTRWLWLATMLGMVALTMLPVVSRPDAVTPVVGTATASASAPVAPVASVVQAPAHQATPVSTRKESPASTGVSSDILLLAAWTLASLLCLAVLVGSAWRIARMRRDWKPAV